MLKSSKNAGKLTEKVSLAGREELCASTMGPPAREWEQKLPQSRAGHPRRGGVRFWRHFSALGVQGRETGRRIFIADPGRKFWPCV